MTTTSMRTVLTRKGSEVQVWTDLAELEAQTDRLSGIIAAAILEEEGRMGLTQEGILVVADYIAQHCPRHFVDLHPIFIDSGTAPVAAWRFFDRKSERGKVCDVVVKLYSIKREVKKVADSHLA